MVKKPWVAPGLIKPPKTQRLPDIVTIEEAKRIFAATRVLSYRVFFFTLYSLGLRLGEGLRLRVGDIDAERGRVPIRDAKGNKDRLVPLPRATLNLLPVLHTNTRQLEFHPHVHLVMPAAAVDGKRRQWRTKRRGKAKGGYLFNHLALAKVFRAKMLAAIAAAGLTLPCRYPEKWVVDCKSVGSGESTLIYLGRYLYRGVIAEKDILACDTAQVSFRYRNAKTGKTERRTVSGAHFLWLVLQHVLPKGFRRGFGARATSAFFIPTASA